MRDITEPIAATTLQYSIDSLDDFRSSVYQVGLQAMDRVQGGGLTPIYFSSNPVATGFDLSGNKTTVANNQNFYKIRESFAKI